MADSIIIDSDDEPIINKSDNHAKRKPRINRIISQSDDEGESGEEKDEILEESFISRPNTSRNKMNRILSDSEDDINEDEDINVVDMSIRKAIRRSIYKVAHNDLSSLDDDANESDDDSSNRDDQEIEYQKHNTSSSDEHEENVDDCVDHNRKHLDHGKKIFTSKNQTNKNYSSRFISESDDDDSDDRDSGKNTTYTSYDVSYENKIDRKSNDGDSFIIKTPTKEDSIDHDHSHKSINSSSRIMSSNDHTKDENEIDDEDCVQNYTPHETVTIHQDKQPPATDNEQKKPAKRSLTKPKTRSEIKKEIKRLTTEIERSEIFLMRGTIESLPDGGKKIKESIVKNQESLDEYKKQLELMEDSNSSVASTDLSHNLSSDKENSLNYPNYLHNSVNSPEANSNNLNFDCKKLLKPTANTVSEGLGKRALATFQNEQALTVERLENLHGSLISQPSENEQVKDPKGLVVQLMPHQKHALAWLTWREKQKPRGGVLADDMGLGKTLTMISLVMKSLSDSSTDNDDDEEDDNDTNNIENQQCKYQGGTIVVCPASLINQWKNEINTRCKRGVLLTEVYHGNNREKVPRRLARNNIVITTYNLLVRESKNNGQLFQIQWKRVILDEAHAIRNHKSQACEAVCQLKAKKRWALTGTPIHNKGMDIFAILKFLKCSPFDDIRVWKRWVENKSDTGMERLAMVMKSLMLRRTKNELITKGDIDSLPEKRIEIINISLDEDERLVYDKVMMYSRTIFAQFLHQRAVKEALVPLGVVNNFKNSFNKAQQQLLARHADVQSFEILVLLLRLRQICCQPSLIHDMLDKNEIDIDGTNGDKDSGQLQNNLVAQLEGLNISGDTSGQDEESEEVEVDKRIFEQILTSKNPVFNPKRCSSKLTVILNLVGDILAKREKLIIVSQWSSYLQIIGEHLSTIPGATFKMFTGAIAVKDRQDIINSFNAERNPKIMLLSLCAGGVGLNLVGANHLLLVDIHWNPQLECQACDRIYRIGQRKNVYIYKLICNDTIEETIQKLQDEKLSLANSILSGKNKESSKLSVQDLMAMFS